MAHSFVSLKSERIPVFLHILKLKLVIKMKTLLSALLLFCTSIAFSQSSTSTSKPNTGTDKPKIGSKTDIRNPFDTTKVKPKAQAKNKETGWGDVGVAKQKNGYIGETEKNKNKATRSDVDKKPQVNNLGVGEDPFGKTPQKGTSKKKNGYANQEVSY